MSEINGTFRNGHVELDSSVDWPEGMRVTVFRNREIDESATKKAAVADQKGLASRYFQEIREAWAPFALKYRIVPFCTPVFRHPSVVVIGTNHSDFDPSDIERSEAIADRYASGILEENTFLRHNHKFAIGLRDWCSHAGIAIDAGWIGTNRCAVQTGSGGIDELKDASHFDGCQSRMDDILRRLLADLAPKNIILTGKYAAALFYPSADNKGTKFVDLKPRDELFGSGFSTRLIPIEHPSRKDLFRDKASQRLADFLLR